MATTSSKQELDVLIGLKIQLLHDLAYVIKEYNGLASEITNPDDWVFGMPIESLDELKSPEGVKRRTRLGDLKARTTLKKKSVSIEHQIQKLDVQIKNAKLSLIEEQINQLLNSK